MALVSDHPIRMMLGRRWFVIVAWRTAVRDLSLCGHVRLAR
jgi:hypothetical protein